LTVDVRPVSTCTETSTPAVRKLTCTPVEGQFQEVITLAGTPAGVRVRQSVDGSALFDQSASPVYAVNRPNGPDCEPTCHQATVAWSIP
jgi:hypothetical protein